MHRKGVELRVCRCAGARARGERGLRAGGDGAALRRRAAGGARQAAEARAQARRRARLGAREGARGRGLGGQGALDRGGEGGAHLARRRGRLGGARRAPAVALPAAGRRPRQRRVRARLAPQATPQRPRPPPLLTREPPPPPPHTHRVNFYTTAVRITLYGIPRLLRL